MILVPLFHLGLLWGMAAAGPESTTAGTPRVQRDPFAPRRPEQRSTAGAPLASPLRQLAILELVILGTATGNRGGFALVQGPDRLTHLAPVKARFADGHLVGISGDWVIFRMDGIEADRAWVTKRTRSLRK